MKTLNIILCLAVFAAANAQTYSTDFPVDENPISEDGMWINGEIASGLWHNVKISGGIAKGLPNYPDWWLDGTALLTGDWGPDQTAEATVWCNENSEDGNLEAEIRLRSSLSMENCDGYEILFNANTSSSAYMYIVRWNGPEQDFDILEQRTGASYGVTTGDLVKGTIIGNVISAYINGDLKLQATDDVYTTGHPGMGFDNNTDGGNEDVGFTSFSATANATAIIPGICRQQPANTIALNPYNFSTAVFDMRGRRFEQKPLTMREPGTERAAIAHTLFINNRSIVSAFNRGQ